MQLEFEIDKLTRSVEDAVTGGLVIIILNFQPINNYHVEKAYKREVLEKRKSVFTKRLVAAV